MQPEVGLRRFVRALLAGAEARRAGDKFTIVDGVISVPAERVVALIGDGALAGDADLCRANSQTRSWLRRAQLEEGESFAAQHRLMARSPDGTPINLVESPLVRLAAASASGEAFLGPHHLEAGERVRRLFERAQLQPRLTMSYSASRLAGQHGAADIPDLVADARREIALIHRLLPSDCAGVVIDVCGLLKGLQLIERERGWPRRSAKLVLRIGLDQLAQHYGLTPVAVGRGQGTVRSWVGEGARPQNFP